VEEFLDFLPDAQREIVEVLRDIVRNCMPEAREKLSYNVPYYFLRKRVCFIWPSAVPWGKVERNGVLFGFCRGNELPDDLNYLEAGSRKIVRCMTFTHVNEIDPAVLRAYLFAAIELDAQSCA
jgi:hypothetical protein